MTFWIASVIVSAALVAYTGYILFKTDKNDDNNKKNNNNRGNTNYNERFKNRNSKTPIRY